MSESRGRLVFAGVAVVVLVAAVAVFAIAGGSGEDDGPADDCLAAWNDDATALGDGVHAYNAHGYRATLLTRSNPAGKLLPDVGGRPSEKERCTVVFASPQVDEEPDFGVRVLEEGRWTGLMLVAPVTFERIEELQRDATETANVTLLPDGRLAEQ